MLPGFIERSKDFKLQITQVAPDLYIVENSYEGVYKFFDHSPPLKIESVSKREEEDKRSLVEKIQ